MVLFIIGIIVSFATLSVGQNTSRLAADEANRLYGLLRLGSDEAVLRGNEYALQITNDGYGFLLLGADGWLPVDDDPMFRQRPLTEGVRLELTLEGAPVNLADKDNPPRIYVLSSGELTPFELRVRSDEADQYLIAGGIDGRLELQTIEPDAAPI